MARGARSSTPRVCRAGARLQFAYQTQWRSTRERDPALPQVWTMCTGEAWGTISMELRPHARCSRRNPDPNTRFPTSSEEPTHPPRKHQGIPSGVPPDRSHLSRGSGPPSPVYPSAPGLGKTGAPGTNETSSLKRRSPACRCSKHHGEARFSIACHGRRGKHCRVILTL